MDEREHILHGLHGLDNAEPAVLSALSRLFDFRTYSGLDLCAQGDPADRLWVLGHGQISVTRSLAQRRPCEVAVMGPTAMIGFSGLMGIETRSASLKAVGTIEVLEMSTEAAMDLLDTEGSRVASAFRVAIIAAVSRQVTAANTNIAKLAVEVGLAESVNIDERLLAAHTLL